MRVLLVHNRYQHRSGEDVVFSSEGQLLRDHGHSVREFTRDNMEIKRMNPLDVGLQTIWSRPSVKALETVLSSFRPDIVHMHNIFPLISPAVLYTCRARAIPVVATLHNYRLVCPKATLYRDGSPCYKCLGLVPAWHSIRFACYRDSRVYSALLAASIGIHWALRAWHDYVQFYIALSKKERELLIRGGLPKEKTVVKPNPVYPDPGVGDGQGEYFLYIGRLSEEKGIDILISTAQKLRSTTFLVVGASTERDRGLDLNRHMTLDNVQHLGRLSHDQVFEVLKGARCLIFPSLWDEPFGLGIVEAFACGVPVIASDRGAMLETVEDGRTGLLFSSGNVDDLVHKINFARDHPDEIRAMGLNARKEFERRYTGERNIDLLLEIYRRASGS